MLVYRIPEPPPSEGKVRYYVTGIYAHYCNDWDGLAVSEFTAEFQCCGEKWSGWRGWLLPVAMWFNRLLWEWKEWRHWRQQHK